MKLNSFYVHQNKFITAEWVELEKYISASYFYYWKPINMFTIRDKVEQWY